MSLKGRKIVLGITGSIAAYKACELLRSLIKEGAQVRVALTPSARRFITPLTLEALSGYPVYEEVVPERGAEIRHTELSSWGELLVVAPATANTIAKIASGIGDTPVTELALCFHRGVLAPAMNVRMYESPVTVENLERLRKLGWEVVEPEEGELACGERGKGRLAQVEKIVQACQYWFYPKLFKGKKFVVTAGATREYIDPVRFISNPSSGRMGFALAKVAAGMGADVVLITGKSCLETPYRVKRVEVESVEEMKEAALREFKDAHVYISAAAIGDYTPAFRSAKKIKKESERLIIELKRAPDVLKTVGSLKRKGQVVVGFAAETDNLEENAARKMREKNLDLVVGNLVGDGVFGSSDTKVVVISKNSKRELRGSKEEVAEEILKEVYKVLKGGA